MTKDEYFNNGRDNEVRSLILTPNQRSRSEQLKFEFTEGKSLYAKQIIIKKNNKIKSPLLLLTEQ